MSSVHNQAVPYITVNQAPPPPYSFPTEPPKQKKRPTQALPSLPPGPAASPLRLRSNTVTAITSWAQHVQPGSPAPHSPHRRPSVSSARRPSINRGRRPSVTSIRLTSSSFLNFLDTPTTQRTTPSTKEFKTDLTTLGYTSVFLQLPGAPFSAALPTMPSTPIVDITNIPIPPTPVSPTKNSQKLNRFRSLSILRTRPRSKSTATPASPTRAKTTKAKASIKASAIVKHKKAKYSHLRPAPLANDLALVQFLEGGHMDTHIQHLMESQAKAAAVGGVGDIYRDGQGGIWWDVEEEWEYAHLLGGDEQVGADEWVQFEHNEKASAEAIAEVRRGSVSTISTQDSDLDVRYVVQPSEESDDLAAFGSSLASMSLQKPGLSVLSLPPHPRRAAKHMRKSEHLLDTAFPHNPSSPSSPRFYSDTVSSSTEAKPRGKARRRPAPLKLTPPSPALKHPHNSPVDPGKVRKDFIENSFAPPPVSSSYTPVRGHQVRKGSNDSTSSGTAVSVVRGPKVSIMNVKSFFRSGKKEEN